MNKYMQAYTLALARYTEATDGYRKSESAFLKTLGYRNADGTAPRYLAGIDDIIDYHLVLKEFMESPLCKLKALSECKDELIKAENNLLDYVISKVPEDKQAQLNEARKNKVYRAKMLEIIMKDEVKRVVE